MIMPPSSCSLSPARILLLALAASSAPSIYAFRPAPNTARVFVTVSASPSGTVATSQSFESGTGTTSVSGRVNGMPIEFEDADDGGTKMPMPAPAPAPAPSPAPAPAPAPAPMAPVMASDTNRTRRARRDEPEDEPEDAEDDEQTAPDECCSEDLPVCCSGMCISLVDSAAASCVENSTCCTDAVPEPMPEPMPEPTPEPAPMPMPEPEEEEDEMDEPEAEQRTPSSNVTGTVTPTGVAIRITATDVAGSDAPAEFSQNVTSPGNVTASSDGDTQMVASATPTSGFNATINFGR